MHNSLPQVQHLNCLNDIKKKTILAQKTAERLYAKEFIILLETSTLTRQTDGYYECMFVFEKALQFQCDMYILGLLIKPMKLNKFVRF